MGARRSPHREGRGPTPAPPVRYAPSPIELGVHSESLRNSVYFCALVGGLLAAVAVWLHGRDGPALPAASAWRVTSTAAQLVLTLAMLYVDLQCCPVAPDPARRGSGADRTNVKFYTIQGAFGHMSFLTDQTLAFSALLHTLMLAAELSLFGLGVPALAGVVRLGYAICPFMAADLSMLTLLWYFLNWKEAKWQKQRRLYERIFR